MRRKSRLLDTLIAAIVAAVTLAVVYAVAYRLLVKRGVSAATGAGVVIVFDYEPQYRIADDVCRRLFWPAHQVDRRMRPDYWRRTASLPR